MQQITCRNFCTEPDLHIESIKDTEYVKYLLVGVKSQPSNMNECKCALHAHMHMLVRESNQSRVTLIQLTNVFLLGMFVSTDVLNTKQ